MAATQAAAHSTGGQGQEFVVRIPKATKKRYNVMRFNAAHNQDMSKWTQVRMERENNMREFKAEEELPKFGAGSEFGREQKEEARRKKYGIVTKKYNPDEQPWLIRVGGKTGKKFKGIREGGVSDNTSYYVFCKAPDGVFEAFPIEEWYNFNPIGRFKALTAEEAEEEFEKRDKVMNHFSIMVRKKMAKDENLGQENTEEKKPKKEKKDFKISDMDDWVSDSDFEGEEGDGEKEDEDDSKKKKAPNKKKKKKSKSDDEAVEESDEGDFDDREVDYMSATSSEEEEPEDEKTNRELKGVEDEDALRGIDQSDEEEEEEKEEEKGSEEEGGKKAEAENKPKTKGEKGEKAATATKPASQANSSGESSSESSDSDFDDSKFQSAMFMQKPKGGKGSDKDSSSRSKSTGEEKKSKSQSKAQKRKAKESSPSDSPKRMRHEASTPPTSNTWSGSTEGITEESVRRYLLRKPMTTTELLQKFKSKKTGLSSDKLVNSIAQILKKLNPIKQTIKGKLYLSIKT